MKNMIHARADILRFSGVCHNDAWQLKQPVENQIDWGLCIEIGQ